MKKLDFVLINAGNTNVVYQNLGDGNCAIEPPTFCALVATYLLNKGFLGKIIDMPACGLSIEEIAQSVINENPVIVGIFVYGYQPSASTQNMHSARQICTVINSINPDLPILISGTHPAALPERTLREEPVQYVCDREGFETLEKLILHHRDSNICLEDIPSLWYEESKRIKHNSHASVLTEQELNTLVSRPAWQLLDMTKYRSHNWHAFETMERTPYASIYTSLNCPFSCKFCCISAPFGKPSYRMWSPEVVIKQIDELVNLYNVRNIKFIDEMFVLNEPHVMGICDLIIDRGYDLNIWAYARVDTVKDRFLEKMRRAGFRWLALGLEAGSKYVRDGANKKFSNQDMIDVVRKIQEHDIYVIGNYIFGLPDDTIESMQNTLDLAIELNCEFSNFYSCMCYPGSKLYTMAVENGLDLPSTWLGYSQHSYETYPSATETLSNKEVLKFRDEAFVKYFSSQRYQNMILEKFGQKALNDIYNMLSKKLRRKILGD